MNDNSTIPPGRGPAPPPHPFTPGTMFGRYRIDRKLGEGGMGAVYLAHDTTLDRPVAIKVPTLYGDRKTAAARFVREARAAAGLHHPNVCPIYDVGQINGHHYLSMRYVVGRPLSDVVAPGKPLPPAEAARIVRTVALAMHAAHQRGTIHRDLKPANILIDDRGEPVVMDFGLARREGSGDGALTLDGDAMGTPAYMPPEQAAGEVAAMGPASDVYSLGVVLYELLVGEPPFTGEGLEVIARAAFDPPPPPSSRRSGLDAKWDAVVLKALAKKPGERWKTMQAFADVLAGFAAAVVTPHANSLGGPTLTLRVAGTPFAYKPPPGLPVVTVGRQRRRAGEPPDAGNDFVLRVAGNDPLSARISRRHFELHRTPAGFDVVDRSKCGVTRNGVALVPGVPTPLADGDVLNVAGVVTLQVGLNAEPTTGVRHAAVVEVPASGHAGGQVQLEASLGDVVTMG